jgi:Tol biopolymer transport system component/C-terminal processing protease CtpA/Prc
MPSELPRPTRVRAARSLLAFVTLGTAAAVHAQDTAPPPAARPPLAEPAVSPDRAEIAFVSGGDVWTVPAGGGEARLLVSHAATESRPLYSPDGRQLAFTSTRTGNGDVYVLTFATGQLRRLTYDDAPELVDGWSRDGRWLYFSSSSQDVGGMNDVFRVRAEGGTPMPAAADRYANEHWAAPSPDGSVLAITARGITSGQWWRRGHSHIDESEIWLARDGGAGAAPRYEAVTSGGAKEQWPMWGADGRTLLYVSDRGGAPNVWRRRPGAEPEQVTRFTDGRVLWPTASYDGRTIVFERDFRIWSLDVASGSAGEVPITLRGAPAGAAAERLALTNGYQQLALSPDGQKVAFAVRGDLFAAPAKDGGTAARVTTSAAPESQIAWAPDSRRIAYVSTRDGAPRLYAYDFTTRAESPLTSGSTDDAIPRFSPDGKSVAFVRGGRELRVVDVASKRERLLATAALDRPPFVDNRILDWSPDGRWIAYLATGARGFTNVSVVPAAGGEARQVSALANAFANSVSWSHDGTYLLFDTGQRTEPGSVARVDLVPRTPKFREDQFRDLFTQQPPAPPQPAQPSQPPSPTTRVAELKDSAATPGAAQGKGRRPPKPVQIVFEDVRERLSLLPIGLDVQSQTLSPDGKTLVVVARAAGQQNLYSYSLDELSDSTPVAQQLTTTTGNKGDVAFSPDGKEVFYLDQGRIRAVTVATRASRPVATTAELDVDFAREKMEVFAQAWALLRDNFFDERFNGVDWNAARTRYAAEVSAVRTPDEMRRVLSLMVGELNASHLGVLPQPGSARPATGRLGLRFARAEYEERGRLRVSEVVPLSPAALAGVRAGEYVTAVDGVPAGGRTNLDSLLEYKIDRRVTLTVAGAADAKGAREVVLRPVNLATERALVYRAWVKERREYVHRASGGRLGYVHMPDMSAGSLAQLYVDLDAENHAREGVVVDIRNNNGGFVNAYAIDAFARRSYFTMTTRGFTAVPSRLQLGQRAIERPTVLVTNQHSLSDAEDFTEGYRALKLGKVVGEPTAGWIIYTWNVSLVDGSILRIPRTRITTADGSEMEMHPRPVDVAVTRPIGESYTGRDSQLDAAVRELLTELGQRAAATQ